MAMNPEIKEKWVKALRSGVYKQGSGVLRSTNERYCCLGVLCEIYKEETGDGEWIAGQPGDTGMYTFLGSRGYLPAAVQNWSLIQGGGQASLPNSMEIRVEGAGVACRSLSGLNDSGYYSFEDIAKVIETYF